MSRYHARRIVYPQMIFLQDNWSPQTYHIRIHVVIRFLEHQHLVYDQITVKPVRKYHVGLYDPVCLIWSIPKRTENDRGKWQYHSMPSSGLAIAPHSADVALMKLSMEMMNHMSTTPTNNSSHSPSPYGRNAGSTCNMVPGAASQVSR